MALTLSTYDPKFNADFENLNREWIEHHFKIEEMDLRQLKNPHRHIMAVGGEVFFALEGEKVLGVCAMIPHGEGSFELAKMAVSPDARGKGVGDFLVQAAVEWARARGAQSITLLSNTILVPAINLYHKHGFTTVRLGPHPDYQRSDIEMVLSLEPGAREIDRR